MFLLSEKKQCVEKGKTHFGERNLDTETIKEKRRIHRAVQRYCVFVRIKSTPPQAKGFRRMEESISFFASHFAVGK